PRFTMPLGMALEAVAALCLLGWDAHSPYAAMWPPFVLIGLGVGMVMSASSDAIVGSAPVRDGGVASGLQSTALQVGGALGTSVLVSLIGSRVGATLPGALTAAGVPADTAGRLASAGDAVAMGVAPVDGAMPDGLRAAVTEGAHHAFLNGVHTAALTTAALCALGALLALAGMPKRLPAQGS
ncbi:MFS transporter, partial [Kitasatospora phosalacinea]